MQNYRRSENAINLTKQAMFSQAILLKKKVLKLEYLLICTILVFINGKYFSLTVVAAKSLQSCPTLCDPIDGSPPGSPVPGILQARTLEWVTISFSNA